MEPRTYDIEILSAASILGLRPGGVECLAETLLACGIAEQVRCRHAIVNVPDLNHLYSHQRDAGTQCLNPGPLHDYSITLGTAILDAVNKQRFALALGGDCSILLGIMQGLKGKGTYGLIFIDAHADFYEPEKSTTGEVADMDLAIVTGRGPEILTNINNRAPYVKDEHVIHIGQRDQEETIRYGSQEIKQTAIHCFDLAFIEKYGMQHTISEALRCMDPGLDGYWIHFDTDVLADEINPAVEYRLPGGLQFAQVEHCIRSFLRSGSITGMSITIYNPSWDTDKSIAMNICESMGKAFDID